MQKHPTLEEQARRLQAAAGIRLSEEVTVSSSGVEIEEKRQNPHGYDQMLDAVNKIKEAETLLNSLIEDQKFNERFKPKFQVYLQQLNNIQAALNNAASGGVKKKEKTLTP